MVRRDADSSELDLLVAQMEQVDDALGHHLRTAQAEHGERPLPLDYCRMQVKAWCARAARRGAYSREVLLSTIMAIDAMSSDELAFLIRDLVGRTKASTSRPAA